MFGKTHLTDLVKIQIFFRVYGHLKTGGTDSVPSKDMQTPPLRSGQLNIRDAQCTERKDVLKKSYHIISRFCVMGVQKMRKKFKKIQKWQNLREEISGLIL